MRTLAPISVIPEIIEEHLEELAFLWGQRTRALRSRAITRRGFLRLEERIEAHIRGLLVGGGESGGFLEAALVDEDPSIAFAAAYALLRGAVRAQGVERAFLSARGQQLDGITQALCHSAQDIACPMAIRASQSSDPAVAAAGTQVLAFHARPEARAFGRFLKDPDPNVRIHGWRAAALAPQAAPSDIQIYMGAIEGDHEQVRQHALLAAAWTRQPWLLSYLRSVRPSGPAAFPILEMLAVLATPADRELLLRLAGDKRLGPHGLAIAGACGDPGAVELLLREMQSLDPATAAAAGNAFWQITGCDVASGNRATIGRDPDSQLDEFDREFLEEVMLPNPQTARDYWVEGKGKFSARQRWCRGVDASGTLSEQAIAELDMQAQWQLRLRSRFNGSWNGRLAELERFPLSQPDEKSGKSKP